MPKPGTAAGQAWTPCSSCVPGHTLFPWFCRTGSSPGTLHMQTASPPWRLPSQGAHSVSQSVHEWCSHPPCRGLLLSVVPCVWELVVCTEEGSRCLPPYGVSCFFWLSFFFFFQAFSVILQAKNIHVCSLQTVAIITTVHGPTEALSEPAVPFSKLCCRAGGYSQELYGTCSYSFVEIAFTFTES